ncbi:MAG TPA: glycosyltransferase family 4 protein [Egibacteraceae bacterium]|nr:glycosyltransferase family 4 protein [Egibacteraceae bacterium]
MTRTLWVTNDFPPRPGGIETFLAGLLARRAPGDTRVLASHWPGDAEHDAAVAYRVDRVGRRPLLPTPVLLRRVRAAADELDAEVVVFGAAWPLGELAAWLDRPTLALTHGHEAGLARVGLGWLVRRVARRVTAVTAVSGYTGGLLGPWVAGHAPLHRLPPGVDTDAFHPGVDGAAVRERHGIAPDAPLAVCVGRLVARKGQDVLVEGWPLVRARLPEARLLLAGAGPMERRLRASMRALQLDRAVTLAGPVGSADVPAHHAAADVFAMPCRSRLGGLDVEGLGIVYLEAQACGRPVVAGRSGGAPEALVDGQTGVVVDGRSPPAVAEALSGLLADGRRRARMGAAGRAFVARHHAWPAIAGRLEQILRQTARG